MHQIQLFTKSKSYFQDPVRHIKEKIPYRAININEKKEFYEAWYK